MDSFSLSHCFFPSDFFIYKTLTLIIMGDPKKCLNVRQKLGTRTLFLSLSLYLSLSLSHSLTHSHTHSLTLSLTHSRHDEQLLFSCLCSKVTFSLSHSLTLTLSHSHTHSHTLSRSHSLIHSLSTC